MILTTIALWTISSFYYCQFDLIHVKLNNAFWIRRKCEEERSDGLLGVEVGINKGQ
jgi:hypothetical protein